MFVAPAEHADDSMTSLPVSRMLVISLRHLLTTTISLPHNFVILRYVIARMHSLRLRRQVSDVLYISTMKGVVVAVDWRIREDKYDTRTCKCRPHTTCLSKFSGHDK